MSDTINTITDRTSWLAWRADWRLRYAEASEEVRAVKRAMRDAVAVRRSGPGKAEVERIDHTLMPGLQSSRENRRWKARRLMKELESAKARRDELISAAKECAIAA